MAKKVREVPKKRQMPFMTGIFIILVLLIATGTLMFAAFQHVYQREETQGFATTNAAQEKIKPRIAE